MRHWFAVLAPAVLATTLAAGTIAIPSTIVNGTDVFSGPTITLTSTVLSGDTLTLTVNGQVFLQPGNTYGTNAAGVVTTPGSVPGIIGVGDTSLFGSSNFGSLLLGNSTFGFHQLFPANGANGLGSLTPPSLLSLTSVPLSSLGFVSTMPGGTILEFLVTDGNSFDNSGSFTLSGQFDTSSVVPEPSSLVLLMAGLAGLGLARRRFC